MWRGEVYWVDFEPARGGEIQKIRPAIIVSSDFANRTLNRRQVVPLTKNTSRVYLGEAIVELNGRRVKAVADQIRTVTLERFGDYMDRLSDWDMAAVEEAIIEQPGLA
jgi:mRNA interferase MazF